MFIDPFFQIDFRVLKSNLEAQKTELTDLCRKLESTQDELEAMKGLCANHVCSAIVSF